MRKNNIVLTIIAILVMFSCASFDPKYKDKEAQKSIVYPSQKELEHRFFLLGDAGYSQVGGTSLGILAFKSMLDSIQSKNSTTIFLGDNIYPAGMPPKGAPLRTQSEYRIDAQLDALETYEGNIIFIPGNHDWYDEGIHGLNEQRDYIENRLKKNNVWAPNTGCGFEVRELSEELTLIIIDSQWFLENWDNNPTINDNCSEIKTREAMLLELDSELKKNENKNVVVALHHPLITNGIHGGNYHFNKHLYPSQNKIPLPILGSLATLIRTTGGVSIQDAQNERYKNMVDRISTAASGYENVMFVSGHEHNLQYNVEDNIHQIVSGSGSKESYASLRNNGVFAFPGQGFAIYDVFKDGSTWVKFYRSIDNEPVLMFQQEVFEAKKKFDFIPLISEKVESPFIQTSIYEQEEAEKGVVYKSIFGNQYRNLYGKKIKAPVAYLDTLYGGMKVIRAGGGHQTRSLRLKDKQGRDYNLRALRKSALKLLQTVAFKDKHVSEDFENTLAEKAIQDFYTAAHPYAFMVVPDLSEAIDIYHTNPKIFYVPKQEALKEYNENYGDELYMLVERPEGGWMDSDKFGRPNEDIESTSGLFERLRRDEEYHLDEATYIRARIFDMLIGDWDRHQDQWRWSEFRDEEGNKTFKPIPRDRDQVFSNFDGAFFATLRGLTGFGNQFSTYGENISDIAWFNSSVVGLDRALLQNLGKEEWLNQAKYIQDRITDDVIETAFSKLPQEIQTEETTEKLKKELKGRRGNIVDIAEEYYNYFAKLAIVTATDKDDFIDITRLEDGSTNISIYRNIQGDRKYVVSYKTYLKEETNDIWIYGLDDDDVFSVVGESNHYIPIKIIGGQNNDIFKIENGKGITVYDHKSKPNTLDEIGNAKLRLTDKYSVNIYNKDKRIYSSTALQPGLAYNPDDGFQIGANAVLTNNRFKRNPFTSQHEIEATYYTAYNGFKINYDAQFANVLGDFNFAIGAHYTNNKYSTNFFGFGNETTNFAENGFSHDYNRVEINRMGVEAGLKQATPFGSYFEYMLSFETVKLGDVENRYISNWGTADGNEFFERKYYVGAHATYKYESYDDEINPTRGMDFELTFGGNLNTTELGNSYAYLKPHLEFYNSISRNRKWVINSHVDSQINIGNGYEFYQAAQLGGETGLRGYRNERFSGQRSFSTGADLRYSFNQFRTRFLPIQIGLFAGGDLGRIWQSEDGSDKWHSDYGGGIFINSAQSINGKFSMFNGEDGWRFSFGLGFTF
ncbi:metallophosphoesterase [Mesonia ostreae]|uniref:Metallophosphoesterase n=1 Tax=Mesonia ostreae TaxID=861110 RepID=A0ABU2KKC7_9FLAO|nr:metallophosphoesterase [Mesonia ostreae]MDT0295146.1 metallophosphoesterase [Mesonia ostreae]